MTTTEQDKELRDLLIEIKFNIRKGDKVGDVPVAHLPHIVQDIDTYLKSDDAARVIELITADRKRVALEARLQEVEVSIIELERSDDPRFYSKDEAIRSQRARYTHLKAQQEEVR